ncbi:hypothetical protein ACFL2I_07730, partial [Candidatus Omnitrophota bacterium]
AGCGQPQEKREVLVKIGDYEITKDRFETEFKDSIYARQDTQQAREQFLDNLINRKLILQVAQQKGLDKEPGFLRMIERFWEQSLLKIVLDEKSRQISGSIQVNEEQLRQLYNLKAMSGEVSQPYEQAQEQLKLELIRSKESEAMNNWITQLRQNTQIEINQGLIGQK